MKKTYSLEELAAIQARRDALAEDIKLKEKELKRLDRILKKASKPVTLKLTEDSPIEDLKLPARPYQVLKGQGIDKVGQLEELTELDIEKMPNIAGKKPINQIKETLAKHGRHLKPNK